MVTTIITNRPGIGCGVGVAYTFIAFVWVITLLTVAQSPSTKDYLSEITLGGKTYAIYRNRSATEITEEQKGGELLFLYVSVISVLSVLVVYAVDRKQRPRPWPRFQYQPTARMRLIIYWIVALLGITVGILLE